jgi:mediator of RNA polymerase II transcription subunit 14
VSCYHCFTDQSDKFPGKRKTGSRQEQGSRRTKHPAYFIPELAHVVALCDERIPFVTLAQEVSINMASDVLDCTSTI